MQEDIRDHLTFWGTVSVPEGFTHFCTTMDRDRWAQAAYHLRKVHLRAGERMIAYDLVTHREKDLADIFGGGDTDDEEGPDG